MEPESLAIRRLQRCGAPLSPEHVAHFREYFDALRRLETATNLASPFELSEGQWALLGFISRAYQLSICCTEMLAGKNWNGFYAGARGLAEAVAAVAWSLQKVARLPLLVREEPIAIGKVMNPGYAKHPELKEMYRNMSFAVHPARFGHLLGFHPRPEDHAGIMTSFSMDFSEYFFGIKVATLVVLTTWFATDARTLLELDDGAALRQGRIMVRSKAPTEA